MNINCRVQTITFAVADCCIRNVLEKIVVVLQYDTCMVLYILKLVTVDLGTTEIELHVKW